MYVFVSAVEGVAVGLGCDVLVVDSSEVGWHRECGR